MSYAISLYKLQQLDSKIQQKKNRLTEVVKGQQEPPELVEARRINAGISDGVTTTQKKYRHLDAEVKDIIDEIAASEKRLYSGSVQNPKELHDLHLKIDSLKSRLSALEDELLEHMILLEETEVEFAQNGAQLKRQEEEWAEKLQTLKQEQEEAVAQINADLAQRKKQATVIPADILGRYDALRNRQRNGVGVAALQNGRCQACRVTVSAHVSQLAHEERWTTCDNCGRMVVVV